MNHLHLDLCGGIAGDMMLGLLLDLGLDQKQLESDLALLNLNGWQLSVRREARLGISGTRVEVLISEPPTSRCWNQIDQLLAESQLPHKVATRSREVFRTLGEAEAKIHNTHLDQVHFHEVGALDAIIDIVGSVAGMHRLRINHLSAGSVPLGFGTNRCAHGNYPLPAPATLALLQGWPIHDAGCQRELVTPTGAALLSCLGEPKVIPTMTLQKTGYGIGGWELSDRPNVLRGLLGQRAEGRLEEDQVCELTTNIDDANPEWLGHLMDDLLQQGALDVFFTPVHMKKNRPGSQMTVVCPVDMEEEIAHRLLLGSGSGGVRRQHCQRYKLERRIENIETDLGQAAVKIFYRQGQPVRVTAEFESCQALARQHGLPLPEVYRRVELTATAMFPHSVPSGAERT